MATHDSILVFCIQYSGGLQFMGHKESDITE